LVGLTAQADELEQLGRVPRRHPAGDSHRECDVLDRTERRQQVAALEDVCDAASADGTACGCVE
jgi:hypothetical protein